jgi:DNA-binding NtrC family response regulator
MASLTPRRGLPNQLLSGDRARILLVNKDPQDLAYYRQILQKLGCQVRASSSFAEGVECLEREPFDLIILDQGCGRFEGRGVLAQAMEVDVELRVLVLARSYSKGCYLEAMQSGALDYHEGPLSAAEIVAFLDTFIPRRNGAHGTSVNRAKAARPRKEIISKVQSN